MVAELFRRSKPLKFSIEEKPWLTYWLCVVFFCGYIFKGIELHLRLFISKASCVLLCLL